MSQQIDNRPPSARELARWVQYSIGGWWMDGLGYLRWRATDYIAFRIGADGAIYVWDKWARDANGKRKPCERKLAMEDLTQFVFQQSHTGGEP